MKKFVQGLALLIFIFQISGCAAATFGAGAATGAILEKQHMDNKES